MKAWTPQDMGRLAEACEMFAGCDWEEVYGLFSRSGEDEKGRALIAAARTLIRRAGVSRLKEIGYRLCADGIVRKLPV